MATIKQKLAFQEIGVNGGNLSKAMAKAGYSPEVAKRTDKLTRTKGWEELTAKFLADDLLAERHLQLLNKQEVSSDIEGNKIYQPDTQAVSKALDMAYKIKDKYAPEKKINLNLDVNEEHRERAINAIRNLRG